MRAILYARVSSEEQVDNWSLSAQKHAFKETCQSKGWQAGFIYSEEGVSAHTDSIEKRHQFKHLLENCRNDQFDVVVVHSLDRWSRNLKVTLESFKILADNNITFLSITENIDYSTPEGKLFISMIGAFAQYFSDSLSKHTSKGLKERALNGFPNGDIPFGYRRADKDNPEEKEGNIYIVPDEAEAVSKIFRMYASGGHSLASLATWMNQQNFRTRNKHRIKNGSGGNTSGPMPFTLYSVRWLLHNPFFTGKVRYRGQLHAGQHEAIIDEHLFDSVQQQLRKAKNSSRSVSNTFRSYLLKGLIRCIYCGYPLWCETTSNGYPLYRERQDARAAANCIVGDKAIRCRVIDEQMEAIIEAIVLEPSWKEKIIAKIAAISEHDQILKERKLITEKLRRLSKVYIDGLIEEKEYNLQRKLLEDTLETLVVPEMDATIKAGELIENLGSIFCTKQCLKKNTNC
jgi:site-specific DNA recombinase